MKPTGIICIVDDIGRIYIAQRLRRQLNIEVGETMEFYVNGGGHRYPEVQACGGQLRE